MQLQVSRISQIFGLLPAVRSSIHAVVCIYPWEIGIRMLRCPEVKGFLKQTSPRSGRPCNLIGTPKVTFAHTTKKDRKIEPFPTQTCIDAIMEARCRVTDDTLVARIVRCSFSTPYSAGIIIKVFIKYITRIYFPYSFRNRNAFFKRCLLYTSPSSRD